MDIFSQLARDEGVQLHPYRDTVGKLTIGIGRNLDDVGISAAEAEYLCRNDVADLAQKLSSLYPWYSQLDEARRGVLLNMGFNLGLKGLQKFSHFLEACSRSDWPRAQAEMLNTLWANQVGDRAKRLALQITTGIWQ